MFKGNRNFAKAKLRNQNTPENVIDGIVDLSIDILTGKSNLTVKFLVFRKLKLRHEIEGHRKVYQREELNVNSISGKYLLAETHRDVFISGKNLSESLH